MNLHVETVPEEHEVNEDAYYVVVDTYAFSTTVTTALEHDTIETVQTERTVEDLSKYDFPTGGEFGNDTLVMNSPLIFRERELNHDVIGLTSDNGAKRVHQLLDMGAENILLGCLRNAEALGQRLRNKNDVYIVPADSVGNPALEDYFAQAIITNSVHGHGLDLNRRTTIRDKAMRMVDHKDLNPRSRERWEFCLDLNSSETVPIHSENGAFTQWE